MTIATKRPTLLVSGVALVRSDDLREQALTKRLVNGIMTAAAGLWDVDFSWGESDGTSGALGKLDNADALVLMGGPDVDPQFYGGDADYKNAQTHFPRTDEAQIALIQAAVDRHMPTLGICRGMQLLNVAHGGTLIQDMSELTGHASFDLLTDFVFDRHTVNVADNSRLADALAPNREPGTGLRTLVHSAHHQAVKEVGEGLVVTARADDGTIEALEHVSAPVAGVQWHPEDPDADPTGLTRIMSRMHARCCPTPVAA